MNEEGQFVCEQHKPVDPQWVIAIEFEPCQCDHCTEQAKFFVLQDK